MRLLKFVIVLFISFSAGSAFAQLNDDISPEFDPGQSVHIYPNPAVEFVSVKLAHIPVADVKVAVHSILGNEMEIESEIIDEHEIRIRVKDLPAGYYLLAVKDEETKYRGTFKFLKR
ncbi:MAG TPA: T9SS type A sorting domain-containing protein [Chryseosolibacter sp.]|nr:T9SS type A sorting domain-containing protein [Chryseosolibacter sp.]